LNEPETWTVFELSDEPTAVKSKVPLHVLLVDVSVSVPDLLLNPLPPRQVS
jgi:hypothetical protein